jgi:exonuclease III
MRIITWNCNMAFRKKAASVLTLKPDVLIVPECEHPEKIAFPDDCPKPTDMLWFGSNRSKGLGIFSYGVYRLMAHPRHNRRIKIIAPIIITGPGTDYNLLAIWAHNPLDPDGRYVEQIWKSLRYYDEFLSHPRTILAGDFNSNTIWDRPKRVGNHSDVVHRLEKKGIRSAYHVQYRQDQGSEQHPTLFMYRHEDKPYHIDYCFLSKDLVKRLKSVEVGAFGQWRMYSDHVPVIVTLRTSPPDQGQSPTVSKCD